MMPQRKPRRQAINLQLFDLGRLEVFVFQVWDYCQKMNWNITQDDIYGLYNGSLPRRTEIENVPGNWDSEVTLLKADYRNWLLQLQQPPPDQIAKMLIMEQSGNVEFHSLAEAMQGGQITERVYINAKMDYALPIMRCIVQYLVLPGHIHYAKIAKSGATCTALYDRIVLYCTSKQQATNAKDIIIQHFDYKHFNSETPALTKILCEGISMGAEPRQQGMTRESFGEKRARIFFEALQLCRHDQDPEHFLIEVVNACRKYNVNPAKPHKNLP